VYIHTYVSFWIVLFERDYLLQRSFRTWFQFEISFSKNLVEMTRVLFMSTCIFCHLPMYTHVCRKEESYEMKSVFWLLRSWKDGKKVFCIISRTIGKNVGKWKNQKRRKQKNEKMFLMKTEHWRILFRVPPVHIIKNILKIIKHSRIT
jgi:hypothetical protein